MVKQEERNLINGLAMFGHNGALPDGIKQYAASPMAILVFWHLRAVLHITQRIIMYVSLMFQWRCYSMVFYSTTMFSISNIQTKSWSCISMKEHLKSIIKSPWWIHILSSHLQTENLYPLPMTGIVPTQGHTSLVIQLISMTENKFLTRTQLW